MEPVTDAAVQGALSDNRQRFAAEEAHIQREADRLILTRYAPASALVDDRMEILQLRGQTARYFRPEPGKVHLRLPLTPRGGLGVQLRRLVAEAHRKCQTLFVREKVPGTSARDGTDPLPNCGVF